MIPVMMISFVISFFLFFRSLLLVSYLIVHFRSYSSFCLISFLLLSCIFIPLALFIYWSRVIIIISYTDMRYLWTGRICLAQVFVKRGTLFSKSCIICEIASTKFLCSLNPYYKYGSNNSRSNSSSSSSSSSNSDSLIAGIVTVVIGGMMVMVMVVIVVGIAIVVVITIRIMVIIIIKTIIKILIT